MSDVRVEGIVAGCSGKAGCSVPDGYDGMWENLSHAGIVDLSGCGGCRGYPDWSSNMTFAEFAEMSGCEYSERRVEGAEFDAPTGYIVHADSIAFADRGNLYNLSDYRVTSHCAGVYWLVRK